MIAAGQTAACFVAGMLAANAVPHFVKGICGDRVPTPFAKPSGKGLSSPTVNAVWGIFNFALAVWLADVGALWSGEAICRWVAAAGATALALSMSKHFSTKHRDV